MECGPLILLDTHAAIWAAQGDLAPLHLAKIDAAAARDELLLSPITAWEIGMLAKKGRVVLTEPVHEYVRRLFGLRGVRVAALSPDIALAAAELPGNFHGDPADRFLVATAAAHRANLFTRDQRILAYASATRHLRCTAC